MSTIDLLVTGARIVDGTGSPAFEGSVALRGDRIARIVRAGEPEPVATRRIEAGGRVLAPGFVDVHQHSDATPFVEPWMDSMLRQGVTTVVVGNCGASAYPVEGASERAAAVGADPATLGSTWSSFAGYLAAVESCRPALNVAALVGHGTLRESVLGRDQRRAPTPGEMSEMRRRLAGALDEGAVGLSSGLIYAPGIHTTTDELVELASTLALHGGVYASHVRGESVDVFDAVAECIRIGRRANIPCHVSHLKVESRPMWGRAGELLSMIDTERARGADVTADQYPYTAWETELAAALPPWTSPEELAHVLGDPAARTRLRSSMDDGEPGWDGLGRSIGWGSVVIGAHLPAPDLTGRTIAELAAEWDIEPFEAVTRLVLADPSTGMVGHGMHEDDVRTIVRRPDVFVASDALAVSPDGPLGRFAVHPRYYGTFPRVLARYVREERLLTLEDAVRKMTSLPAGRFGLVGRGRIEEGGFADLVLLDPDRVADRATYERPHVFADGIDLVVVGGRVAWEGRRVERAGRTLRRGVA
jgi:N-acyl-D-aspartate/D-glutamate deacylase